MAKCNEKLTNYIIENSEWFEQLVLTGVMTDLTFFNKVRPILCVKSGAKGKFTDDFCHGTHNVLYAGIKEYNEIFTDSSPEAFTPVNSAWLQGWLTTQANKGKFLSAIEVGDTLTYFKENIEDKVEDKAGSLTLAEIGISSYLKYTRSKKVMNQMSVNSMTLDDLRMVCEENLDLISKLEQESRLKDDVPDRVDVRNIPDFSDPNKAVIAALESDIPKLNEAIGGFRKGKAYLIMGGQGGGKTIIACQLASAFSYSCNANGLFISTEQNSDELYCRIVANRCGIPHRIISNGIFKDKLTPMELDNYMKFRRDVMSLTCGDMRIANWGNKEKNILSKSVSQQIDDEIKMYEDETGKKIDYVILDWIGGALGNLAENADKIRLIYQDTADSLEALARKRNFVAVALAQLHPSAVNRVQLTAADLSECKSMSRNYSGVIAITSLYSEEYNRQIFEEKNKRRKDFRISSDIDDAVSYNTKQYLSISKARFGVQKNVPFKREYEYQRVGNWA